MSRIKIMVASNSLLLRDGIRTLLSPCSEVEIVGLVDAGNKAIEELRRLRPQILILDIPQTAGTPLELLARLKAELPDLRVIALSYQRDEASILSVLEIGVEGYLCGREGAAELVGAIRAVGAGDSYLCPAASGVLVRHYRRKGTAVN